MSNKFKLLLFSHFTAFATGIYIGKMMDADELAAYRSASNDATMAWVKKVLIIGGVVGGFMMIVIGGRSKSNKALSR